MARMTFKAGDEYALKLSRLATGAGEIARKAIYAGAAIVADAIKANIAALPGDQYRFLREGETFVGVSQHQRQDLINSFGISPIKADENGDWNAKLGFDGYGSIPTKKYPQGLPNALLARAAESGSSVRQKTPFVRPAVNTTKPRAKAEMGRVVDEETKKIMR